MLRNIYPINIKFLFHKMPNKKNQIHKIRSGFSIFELSIIILIVAILVVGAMQGGELVRKSKVTAAAALTKSSVVREIDGLVLWYETTMPTSIDNAQAADGVSVATWKDISDISVNPQNLVQGDTTKQPLYTTNSINGLPALKFDGSNDYIEASLSTAITSSQLEVFVVAKRNQNVFYGRNISLYKNGVSGDSDNVYSTYIGEDNDGDIILAWRNNTSLFAATHPGNNVPYIVSIKFDGTNNTSYYNGTAQTPVASAGNFHIDNVSIGAGWQDGGVGRYFNGYIAEVIVFDRALSDQERNNVNQYLSMKWGITIS